nr:calcitonin receptor, CTR {alternatively spliced} [human, placenta, Peptide Partial, 33 aa] [Homo sapiens]
VISLGIFVFFRKLTTIFPLNWKYRKALSLGCQR